MADLFISYATPDREAARRIADCLQERGYTVWWDRTIPPGRHFDEVIQEALEAAKCVIVLWSTASVRSNWVKTEAAEAQSRGRLIPAKIEPVTPPMEFKRIQAADLSQWDGSADHPEFGSLLASIQAMMQHAQAPSRPVAPTLAGSAPPLRIEISRRAAWISVAVIAMVALILAFYTATSGDRSPDTPSDADHTSSDPSSPSSTPEPGGRGNGTATSSTDGTANNPSSPSFTTRPAPSGPRGNEVADTSRRINLLSPENQGELVVADSTQWNHMVDGKETITFIGATSAVFAFRENRAATFDTFAVLIPEAAESNLNNFELLAGNDSPTGHFESIGKFKTINTRIIANPFQEFRFREVKAKYLKVRALDNHAGGGGVVAYEMALFGRLE